MYRMKRTDTNRANFILSDKALIAMALIAIIGYFVLANILVDTTSTEQATEATVRKPYISKQKAAQIATEFIYEQFQIHVEPIDVFYQTAKELEGYLQKHGWLDDYMQRDGNDFPLHYYQVIVGHEDRYLIYINPATGNVFAWEKSHSHRPVDLVDPDEERLHLAERYLMEQGYRLAQWELIESSIPYRFITAHDELTYGKAIRYVQIEVADDGNILSFTSGFTLPEEHTAWMLDQDQFAAQMSVLYLLISFLFLMIAIFIAVYMRKEVSFKRGLWLAILFLITHALQNVNMLPTYRMMMGSDVDSAVGSIIYLLFMQFYTVATAFLVYFALVSGDGLWRRMGRNLWMKLQEETSRNTILKAMGRGYLFSLIILGLQQTFYLFAQQNFDVWTVDDPLFSVHNLLWPFLYPLLAWAAAISEEAIFRLFSIALFKKLLRNTFIAAFISSMIWAIGHMTYPIYPVYTRFIEVTLLGLIFAFIMLKYGWITAVFAHASVNCILTGISLMVEFSGAMRLIALFYIASPAIIAYIIYKFQRKKRRSQLSLR